MKKLAATAVAVAFLSVVPAPAQATVVGSNMYHGTDTGIDPPIKIGCTNGEIHRIAEGRSSADFCLTMNRIRVAAGTEIWCDGPWAWSDTRKIADDTGWHDYDHPLGLSCTVRSD